MKHERIPRNAFDAVGSGDGGGCVSRRRADQHALFAVVLPLPVQLAGRADTAQRAGRDVRVRETRGTGFAGRTGFGLPAVRVETGVVFRSTAVLAAGGGAVDHDDDDDHGGSETVHFGAVVHPAAAAAAAEPVLSRRSVKHDFRCTARETGLPAPGTPYDRKRSGAAVPCRTVAEIRAAAHVFRTEIRSVAAENRTVGQRKRRAVRRETGRRARPQVPGADAAAAIPPSVHRTGTDSGRGLRQAAPTGADRYGTATGPGHVDHRRALGGDPAERDRRIARRDRRAATIQIRLHWTQTAAAAAERRRRIVGRAVNGLRRRLGTAATSTVRFRRIFVR